jgi:hypothetical protein
VDQQLKQLMKELGEAINESLADSDQIAEVVSRIKDGGYDIFLVLEATIGVSRPGEKTEDKTSMVTTLTSNPELKVSDQDLKFLKSLRIKIEDDAASVRRQHFQKTWVAGATAPFCLRIQERAICPKT